MRIVFKTQGLGWSDSSKTERVWGTREKLWMCRIDFYHGSCKGRLHGGHTDPGWGSRRGRPMSSSWYNLGILLPSCRCGA